MANPYAQQAYLGKTREDVVVEYAPLVRQIANRLAARLPDSLDREDLIQAGMIGLLDAIEKYDSRREAQFRTYAEFRIKGAMLDDLRACDWVPRSVREHADRIGAAMKELTYTLGRVPEDTEVAAQLGISLADYHQLLVKSRTVHLLHIEDLQRPGDEGGAGDVFDHLEDPFCIDPLDALSLKDLHARLTDAVGALPEKERLVLSLYYDEALNLKEIGEVLGVTESRVSQIRTQAILRLRASLTSVSSVQSLDILLSKRAT
ncbi:MAG: RNA polymerase sigma factor FliA [Opitutales bacterium]